MFATLFTTCLLVAVGGVAYYIGKFVGASEEVNKAKTLKAEVQILKRSYLEPLQQRSSVPFSIEKMEWDKAEEW